MCHEKRSIVPQSFEKILLRIPFFAIQTYSRSHHQRSYASFVTNFCSLYKTCCLPKKTPSSPSRHWRNSKGKTHWLNGLGMLTFLERSRPGYIQERSETFVALATCILSWIPHDTLWGDNYKVCFGGTTRMTLNVVSLSRSETRLKVVVFMDMFFLYPTFEIFQKFSTVYICYWNFFNFGLIVWSDHISNIWRPHQQHWYWSKILIFHVIGENREACEP